VHLSDIRVWEQWGLLESGFAPIYDRGGRVVAMAGADVNISTIRDKTSAALAQVGITSIIALLIAGFLSVAIARSLTRPLGQVKEAALQVAAGQYGHQIDVRKPRELAELADSFSAMSGTLAATVQESHDLHQELERRRRQSELRRVLCGWAGGTGKSSHAPALPSGAPLSDALSSILAEAGAQQALESRLPLCSGSVASGDGCYFLYWMADPEEDTLRAARVHAEIALIGQRLLEYYREHPEPVVSRLQDLYQEAVSCFALLDVRSESVLAIARRSSPGLVMEDGVTVR
jgi:HAMP domain-containing protein